MSEIPNTPAANASPEGSNAPPKKRPLRWRIFRFCLLSFVGLITLFALFHAEENWRGKRAWEQYRKEQEAKGVSFDFNSVVPPPIPDEQNFAMTPLLKPLLDLNPNNDANRLQPTAYEKADLGLNPKLPDGREGSTLWQQPVWRAGQRINLTEWQDIIFASTNLLHRTEKSTPFDDVLYAFKTQEAAMSELLRASKERPLSRFNVNYDKEDKAGILLPHLTRIKSISQAFRIRAAAYLAAGKPDEAFADVNMIFTLADSVRTEPVLISYLVRIACLNLAHQALWEGLVDHRWNQEQLNYWQNKLTAYDLMKDSYASRMGEQAFGNSIFEYIRKHPEMIDNIGSPESKSPSGTIAYKLIPTGWFYFEQINYNTLYTDLLLTPAGKNKAEFDVDKVKEAEKRLQKNLGGSPWQSIKEHKVLVRMLLPALETFIRKCAYSQSTTDLAIIAIALEKYYLKHRSYPESLDQLTPDFISTLPNDLLAKKPFNYSRSSSDEYKLWSVGWDLKDDKGAIVRQSKSEKAAIKTEEGDWTWPQPVKE